MKNSCIVYDSSSGIKNGQYKDVYVLSTRVIEETGGGEISYEDGIDISTETIEKNLLNGRLYKTAASNLNSAYILFEELEKEYEHIYVFLIHSALSEGQANGIALVAENFPSIKIIPQYMLARMAQWECEELVELNKKNQLNEKSAIEVANDYRDNFGCCIIVPDLSCLIKGGRLAKTQDGTSGSDVPALVSLDRNGNKFLNKSTDVEKIFEIMETYFKTVITDFSFSKVEKICVLQATHTGKNFNGKIYEEQFKKTFAERLPTGVIVEKQSLPGVIIAHIGPDYYAVALKIKK